MFKIEKLAKWVGDKIGYSLVPWKRPDVSEDLWEVIKAVKPYTLTSIERLLTLHDAVRYVVESGVAGDIVECGVWKGGSLMMAGITLQMEGAGKSKCLWGYDTFSGMTKPSIEDVNWKGEKASELIKQKGSFDEGSGVDREDVVDRLNRVGVPYMLHTGDVKKTIPLLIPKEISVLRLDLDWGELTEHCLMHLWERVSVGGILIVDDYGYWKGCRDVVDEWLKGRGLFMGRVDYTGRVVVKR